MELLKKLFSNKNVLLLVSVLGIAVSLYLTYAKLTASPVICKFGDCGTVQNSPYSNFLGIPVAVLGVFYYLVLITLIWFMEENVFRYKVKSLLHAWVIWGVIFSTYLTYLEIYVIEAICMWCVISFVCILIIFAILVFDYFSTPKVDTIATDSDNKLEK